MRRAGTFSWRPYPPAGDTGWGLCSRNFSGMLVLYGVCGCRDRPQRVAASDFVLLDEDSQMALTLSKQWVAAPLAALILFAGAGAAQAKGCLKGAAVGGVAGHFAHHHAVLGAAAGCIVGHHLAKKKEREERAQREEQRREEGQRHSESTTGH